MPATASSSRAPPSTSATTAASAFDTLNAPASEIEASASTPPGPTMRNEDPSAPDRTSKQAQSASGRPDAEYVVTGTGADVASRRPYLSSMLTTPITGGTNSDA